MWWRQEYEYAQMRLQNILFTEDVRQLNENITDTLADVHRRLISDGKAADVTMLKSLAMLLMYKSTHSPASGIVELCTFYQQHEMERVDAKISEISNRYPKEFADCYNEVTLAYNSGSLISSIVSPLRICFGNLSNNRDLLPIDVVGPVLPRKPLISKSKLKGAQ